jgi:integrase/recombinase XerC
MSYGNALTIWKPKPKVYEHVSQSEALSIIDKCSGGPKYRNCFKALWYTGLRINEVLAIRVKDVIDSMDGPILIITREKKGDNTHTERLPIPAELGRTLKDYYQAARLQPNDKLFPGHDNSYRYQLRQAAKDAGIDYWQHIHPHMFRHGFIYYQVSKGTHPLVLTQLVGHSSLAVTQGYYQPQESDLRKAMES